ncbi:MAG: class I SAM-dependent methyltransferase [Anaerolineaceae bacterium]|nr:class I SAM-dependent methyltransferase [Anaerolineaceae bacterium]
MTDILRLPDLSIVTSPDWGDYSLLDSGNGFKLERFGEYRLVRPEAEAIWQRTLPAAEWADADGKFFITAEENGGHWETSTRLPKSWLIQYKGLRMRIQTSASRHVGVFPEQAAHWDWISNQIRAAGKPVRVLNLFGYTGLATLAAAAAGANVTHIDASRKAIAWARENQELSGLTDKPVRWIVEDVLKFIRRENRRGVRYEGLILDPPKFGRGPKGEVWEFYKLISELNEACRGVLSSQPLFVVITAYAVKASALTLYYALGELMSGWKGKIEAGEIALEEKSAGRLLSTAIFSRWSSG